MKITSLLLICGTLFAVSPAHAAISHAEINWTGDLGYFAAMSFHYDDSLPVVWADAWHSHGISDFSFAIFDPSMHQIMRGDIEWVDDGWGYFDFMWQHPFFSFYFDTVAGDIVPGEIFEVGGDLEGHPTMFARHQSGKISLHLSDWIDVLDEGGSYQVIINGAVREPSGARVPDHASTAVLMLGALAGLGIARRKFAA